MPCHKISFDSKKATSAHIKAFNAPWNKATTGKKVFPYECVRCGMWHMTSQSKSEKRRHKKRQRKDNA